MKGQQGLEAGLWPAQGWGGELSVSLVSTPPASQAPQDTGEVQQSLFPLPSLMATGISASETDVHRGHSGTQWLLHCPGEETEEEPRPSLLSQLLTRLSSHLWFLTAVVGFCFLSPSWVFLKGSGEGLVPSTAEEGL